MTADSLPFQKLSPRKQQLIRLNALHLAVFQACHFSLLLLLQCLSLPSDYGSPVGRHCLPSLVFLESFMEFIELNFSFPLSAYLESC